jgi:hypothetical protein
MLIAVAIAFGTLRVAKSRSAAKINNTAIAAVMEMAALKGILFVGVKKVYPIHFGSDAFY